MTERGLNMEEMANWKKPSSENQSDNLEDTQPVQKNEESQENGDAQREKYSAILTSLSVIKGCADLLLSGEVNYDKDVMQQKIEMGLSVIKDYADNLYFVENTDIQKEMHSKIETSLSVIKGCINLLLSDESSYNKNIMQEKIEMGLSTIKECADTLLSE
jgi:argininosuccinate lyase